MNNAQQIVNELRANFVRVETGFSSSKINSDSIASRRQDSGRGTGQVHTLLVVGARDMEAGNVCVRIHGNLGAKPKGEVMVDILASIKERRA